jgi:hypothetical protein
MPTKSQLESRVRELELLLTQNGISQGSGSVDTSGSLAENESPLSDTVSDESFFQRFSELETRLSSSNDEVEQLRVQLAGCTVAALGGTGEAVVAKQGQWGWSPSYQDVLNLRIKYEQLLETDRLQSQKEKSDEMGSSFVKIDGQSYPILLKRSAKFVNDEVLKHHIDENHTAVIIERYGD